jgi:FtsZ-interacting cell division protein ZipA
MSDLQLSLLVIGAVVIVGVYLYNWVQERGFQRRMQQAFGEAHDDVLLKAGVESVLADGRLEPQLPPREPAREDAAHAAGAATGAAAAHGGEFDPLLDFAAEIEADAPISDSLVSELMSKIAACGKPVRFAGFDPRTGTWDDVVRGRGGRYTRLRLALQLVNRGGAVNPAQLAAFCDAARACADKIPAAVACPDSHAALKQARELDAFCADVDVAVGVNVVAREGATFPGTAIRAAAEAAGFKLEPDGVFHFRNDRRQTLFTLDNHEPAPFLPESIKGLTTGGVTLLLDVPRVADGAEAMDRMVGIAASLAAALGGHLVDDNRAALSEAGIARIKEQVRSIHAAMAARDIPAGSARAQRLFS